ncbi:MAG: SAM-dependent methyltransferase [Hyphomicrobium sp.]|nr:MAG: SAM-dependent methyltransferase [Hyphomicrobium sp.]PPD00820.1 MAG: SAM-dependent methyltransferase [Hyphomicrobium sp.]
MTVGSDRSPPATPEIFDRALLQSRRNRVAEHAHRHDFLLKRVSEDVCERLSIIRRDFAYAGNVGAHHGLVSRHLRTTGKIKHIVDTDSADRVLARSDGPIVRADEEALPFAAESLDLIVSGLSLHLVNDLPGSLVQIRRALKPDGLFLGALLGGETLKELREAWLIAEDEVMGGASPRVAPFADVKDLGGLLQRAGFALPVADSDVVTVRYATALDLMRDIKGMGASNMLTARRRVPVTRRLLLRAADVYSERFSEADGRVPATFEIITLTAWAPHDNQQKPLAPGSATMRLADALGVNEQPAGEKTPRKT